MQKLFVQNKAQALGKPKLRIYKAYNQMFGCFFTRIYIRNEKNSCEMQADMKRKRCCILQEKEFSYSVGKQSVFRSQKSLHEVLFFFLTINIIRKDTKIYCSRKRRKLKHEKGKNLWQFALYGYRDVFVFVQKTDL